VWDGNEVWLIAAGGVLFLAFPRLYAAGFSGFYLALTIVLWLLILRGVAIESRSRQENPLWREFWDTTFSLASALLAVVLGTALGNVVRGVPLDSTGSFFIPLFTDLQPGERPGVFDWVHGSGRGIRALRAGWPWGALPRLEDHRPGAGAQPALGAQGVAGRGAAMASSYAGHDPALSGDLHKSP
jgi:hypothetical protein